MTIARVVLAAVAVLLLAGCTPSPVDPTPTPAPTASVTATPTPTPAALERFTLLPDALTAIDDAGAAVSTFTYNDPIDQVTARITELVGFEPVIVIHEQQPSDGFAGTEYQWEGVSLYWRGFENDPGNRAGTPLEPAINVVFSSADVRGVALYGPNDVHVGGDYGQAAALFPEYQQEYDSPDGSVLYTQTGVVPAPAGEGNDGSLLIGVMVSSDDGSGLITSLSGPSRVNYGA